MTEFRCTQILAAVVLPLLLAWGGWSCANDDAGKTYMGREIAPVMGWEGAAWLERPEREREERSDLLIAALDLRPEMVVADIGAGTGRDHCCRADKSSDRSARYATNAKPGRRTSLGARPLRLGHGTARPLACGAYGLRRQ